MEDPAISLVGVVNSYISPQQQPSHHQQQRQPSPDLIQLSDSDCNLPPQRRHEPGYTIMHSEDCDPDDENNDGEEDDNDNQQQACGGDPEDMAPLTAECASGHHSIEDRELLEDGMEEYAPGVTKNCRGDRRGTSGSSDPAISSPGSVSSPGSDSATPTNMMASHHHDPSTWTARNTLPASHRHASNWHRLVNDEHCQLLGTEEDSSDRHSSNDEEEEEEEEEDQLLQNAQEVCMDPLPSPSDGVFPCTTSTGRPLSGSGASVESASFVNNNNTSSAATDTTQYRTVPAEPPDARVGGAGGGGDSEGIWRISEEQLAYYTQQFRRLQPDLNKALSGHQAKVFFEKSKLPTEQLTRVWHLSDVSQDGALSLPEFLVAMHLVVARRNSIPLPAALPPPLLALLLPSLQHHSAGHHKQQVVQQQVQQDNQVSQQRSGGAGSSSSGTSSVAGGLPPPSTTAPTLPPSDGGGSEGDKETGSPSRAKEWTKFADSPTSTVSSPGLKPVNFDFQKNAVEKNPKVLHPKALRLTPEPNRGDADTTNGLDSATNRGPTSAPHPSHEPTPSSTTSPHHHHLHHQHHQHTGSSSSSSGSGGVSPLRRRERGECQPVGGGGMRRSVPAGLHRPLPRKPPPHGGPLLSATSLGNESSQYGPASLPLGGVTSPVGVGKREHHPPPPPPPRPVRTHTRSSSLDLNKFNRGGFGAPSLGAPPAVPPRASPGTVSPGKKLVYQRSDGDAAALRDEQHHTASSIGQQVHRQKIASQQLPDHLLRLDNSLPLEPRQQALTATDKPRASAFEVYRKPSTGDSSSAFDRAPAVSRQEAGQREAVDGHDTGGSSGSSAATGARLKDKKEVCASIRTTRDRNTILARLNTELNQELAEVIEERIALEMQLEQMKLFTN